MIAVLAVTLLVMMVLVVLSVMSGLLEMVRVRNHDWAGDIVISRESLVGFPYYQEFIELVDAIPDIDIITPVISTYTLVETDLSRTMLGVRPDEFFPLARFDRDLMQDLPEHQDFILPMMTTGNDDFSTRYAAGPQTAQQRRRGFMDGVDKPTWDAMRKGQFPWQDGRLVDYFPVDVTVFAIDSRGTLTGSEAGENQRFWYANSFCTGLPDVDGSLMVSFDELQMLCWMDGSDGNPPRTSQIRIRLHEGANLEKVYRAVSEQWRAFVNDKNGAAFANLLEDVAVQRWDRYRREFIAPMENERSLMIVVFSMIAVVAIFIIFAIFYMIVTEKIKDLGVIKSLGGSRWSLAQIFLGYGLFVGAIGSISGTVAGSLIVIYSNQLESGLNTLFTKLFDKKFQIWPPEVYSIDKIPDTVDVPQAGIIVIIALLACLLGAVVPARRAARLEVVEALRVE